MTKPLRLKETPDAAPIGAKVIDARYTEIAPKRRGWLGRVWSALVALFWAAVLGFLVPPAWIAFQRIGEMFSNQ